MPMTPSTVSHIELVPRCTGTHRWRWHRDKEQGLAMNRLLFRRIVCAVDLSDQSASSLKRAVHLAHLHGAQLLGIHATNRRLATTEYAQRTVTDADRKSVV